MLCFQEHFAITQLTTSQQCYGKMRNLYNYLTTTYLHIYIVDDEQTSFFLATRDILKYSKEAKLKKCLR